jgi:hypothetical protein
MGDPSIIGQSSVQLQQRTEYWLFFVRNVGHKPIIASDKCLKNMKQMLKKIFSVPRMNRYFFECGWQKVDLKGLGHEI